MLIKMHYTSVNPIDVKRASGYGNRLLSLKKAAHFPLVLGNDVVGEVLESGPRASDFQRGDWVVGVNPTGPRGTHSTHALIPETLLRRVPDGSSTTDLACLPYTFMTLWNAFQALKLHEDLVRGKKVLVYAGASALGQLCTQMLSRWGAKVVSMASRRHQDDCLSMGAAVFMDRHLLPIDSLPQDFDLTFNFGSWEADQALVRRLRPGAIGHASTVHPLMSAIDSNGWLKGGWEALQAFKRSKSIAQACGARYTWTIFNPTSSGMDALIHAVTHHGISLNVGKLTPLTAVGDAFTHIAEQRRGRAVLACQRV